MHNRFLPLTVLAAAVAMACVSPTLSLRAATSPASPLSTPGSAFAEPSNNAPAGPAITAVELRPATTLLVQPCPVELIFHGEITTTRATAVTYTWVDSRGRTWPQHHRRFSLAGVNGVTHKWKVGKPGRTVDAWVQLKVISPQSLVSNKVPVHFTCAK